MSLPFRLLFTSALLLPAAAQDYTFQPLSVQGLPTYAQGINNRGAVVGYYSPAENVLRAFKRHANGTFEIIDVPELFYESIVLYGINNFGDMVGGSYFYARGITVGTSFKLSAGQPRTLSYLNFPDTGDPFANTSIYGINNAGDVVGRVSGWGGVVKTGGEWSEIAFPGTTAYGNTPYGIGSDGTVVGCFSRSGDVAFLRGPRGRFLELIIPEARTSCALGISNPAGKIVGRFQDTAGKWHGFVYDYAAEADAESVSVAAVRTIRVKVVDYPGATRTEVRGINGQGVIVGWANMPNGSTISFLGVPAQE